MTRPRDEILSELSVVRARMTALHDELAALGESCAEYGVTNHWVHQSWYGNNPTQTYSFPPTTWRNEK